MNIERRYLNGFVVFDPPHSVPLGVPQLPVTDDADGRPGAVLVYEKPLHRPIDHGVEFWCRLRPCSTMRRSHDDEA